MRNSTRPFDRILDRLQQPCGIRVGVPVSNGVFGVREAGDLPGRVQRIRGHMAVRRGLFPQAVPHILDQRVQHSRRLRHVGSAIILETHNRAVSPCQRYNGRRARCLRGQAGGERAAVAEGTGIGSDGVIEVEGILSFLVHMWVF